MTKEIDLHIQLKSIGLVYDYVLDKWLNLDYEKETEERVLYQNLKELENEAQSIFNILNRRYNG